MLFPEVEQSFSELNSLNGQISTAYKTWHQRHHERRSSAPNIKLNRDIDVCRERIRHIYDQYVERIGPKYARGDGTAVINENMLRLSLTP